MSTYPDQDEILGCADHEIPRWIDKRFLRADPFAFSHSSGNLFGEFVHESADAFEVDPNGIFCVGSGAVGLSLSPNKIRTNQLKRFDKDSDIDLAIISSFHFEQSWRDLRIAGHKAYGSIPSKNLLARLDHQRARMFDGAIVANRLLSRLSFGPSWLAAHKRLQLDWTDRIGLSGKGGINLWIYRDYWSVRSYVADGIMKCTRRIESES